jgi:hypothetical protein
MASSKESLPTREREEWQREHEAAVEALRKAEEGYQRVIAGSAFLPGDDPSPVEVQRDTLNRLEEARRRLAEVRQARPEP